MNETIKKFGWPQTLLFESSHWVVLLRPAQVTLGSLVLAANSDARTFGELPPAAFAELHEVVRAIEHALAGAVQPDKLNYLMLMMVDPYVHFHVIPRYAESRSLGDLSLADHGWPGAPALATATSLAAEQMAPLMTWLKGAFAGA